MTAVSMDGIMHNNFQSIRETEDELSTSLAQMFIDAIPKRKHSIQEQPSVEALAENDIKILLLENLNEKAIEIFNQEGYQVESYGDSLSEEELIDKIGDIHVIGIGPKTKITANVLKHATNLMTIGCFCIGTGNVDTEYAASLGIAVFHSPFSNSRSVAELVVANIINLARQVGDRSNELHNGVWKSSSKGCWEIRGKILGIIGYGHIGSQVSILAEALGMHVIYYDVQTVMPLGGAKQVPTLNTLLKKSDFVSLHVPENCETLDLLGRPQFAVMKKGSYVLNTSRGSAIDMDALIEALKTKKLVGAALDVFPNEPLRKASIGSNNRLNKYISKLSTIPNVILTPHIGGSTEEAQDAIGEEVAESLINYLNEGNSIGAVNFPQIELKTTKSNKFNGDNSQEQNLVRILYIHNNIPGVLRTINNILWDHNIEKQYYDSTSNISYLITDIRASSHSEIMDIYEQLESTPDKLLVRLLYC